MLAEPTLAKSYRFPLWSPVRKWSVSRAFHYMFYRVLSKGVLPPGPPHRAPIETPSLSKPPVKQPPPCSPNRSSVERETLCFQTHFFFIHLHLLQSPVTEPSPEKGDNIRSPSTEPHVDGGVRPGSPVGSVTTPVPCSLQHDSFYLGLGRPEVC